MAGSDNFGRRWRLWLRRISRRGRISRRRDRRRGWTAASGRIGGQKKLHRRNDTRTKPDAVSDKTRHSAESCRVRLPHLAYTKLFRGGGYADTRETEAAGASRCFVRDVALCR